jgi:hypothetical protein
MKAERRDEGQYLLVSFEQRNNIRQYSFSGRTEEGQRHEFLVDVDLGLIRRHRIPMQEIPLLCCRLLEERAVSLQDRQITLTEAHMEIIAERAAELKRQAEQRRNWSFKPRPAERAG